MVALEDCVQTPLVDQYIAVRPFVSEGWFVIHLPTGDTVSITAVGRLGEEVAVRLRTQMLTWRLSNACEQVDRGIDDLASLPEQQVRDKARTAYVYQYGQVPVRAAEARAALGDYDLETVALAWAVMGGSLLTEDVVTVSELLQEEDD